MQSEDPADRAVAALAMGNTTLAAAQLSAVESPGFRITALGAELAQAERRYADAIAIYELMLHDLRAADPRLQDPPASVQHRRDVR